MAKVCQIFKKNDMNGSISKHKNDMAKVCQISKF